MVFFEDIEMFGFNIDYFGFIVVIKCICGGWLLGWVVLIGVGGVGWVVVFGLVELNVIDLCVFDLEVLQVMCLVFDFKVVLFVLLVDVVSSIEVVVFDVDGLINCILIGMDGYFGILVLVG